MTNNRFPGILAVFALVFTFLFLPAIAYAEFKVTGDTTTVIEWFDDPQGDQALPAYQYLRLNLNDSSDGVRQRFRIYGRLAEDLNDEVDKDGRLYYAYYQRKNRRAGTDLKIGRFWINTVAGSPFVDGAGYTFNIGRTFRTLVFGGGYGNIEADHSDDYVLGAQVTDLFWDKADVSLSYLQKWIEDDLARELLGMSGRIRVARRGSAYGEVQLDLLSEMVSYYLAGLRLVPGDRWTFKTEVLGYQPVFDSTSIYSVFAVDEYREVSVSADYRFPSDWIVFGGYTREFYESFDDADVMEAGFEVLRPQGVGGYLVAVYREGYEDLQGLKGNLSAPIFLDIRLNVGAEYNVYSRVDDGEGDDTTAERYWVEGQRNLGDSWTLKAKVERIQSAAYDYYNRGRISLRYRF